MRVSRISKIAGVGVAGFLIVSGVADKININPVASQVAGFVGAFVGSLLANRRAKRPADREPEVGAKSRQPD